MQEEDPAPDENDSGIIRLRRLIANTPTAELLAQADHSSQSLRAVARAIAAEARAQDAIRAERLLIELRRVWRELPEARHLEPRAQEELWDRLVRTCIEEFYRPSAETR